MSVARILLPLLLLAPLSRGVGFRISTCNVGTHLVIPPDGGPTNFDYGIDNPGAPDQEGLPDLTDYDDDNDLQTDADERLFGTSPLDASSIYRPSFVGMSPGQSAFSFQTPTGRRCTVQRSTNRSQSDNILVQSGNGIAGLSSRQLEALEGLLPPGRGLRVILEKGPAC